MYICQEKYIPDWRQEIIDLCKAENLDINFTSPVTNHEASDNCGVEITWAAKTIIIGKITKGQKLILLKQKNP